MAPIDRHPDTMNLTRVALMRCGLAMLQPIKNQMFARRDEPSQSMQAFRGFCRIGRYRASCMGRRVRRYHVYRARRSQGFDRGCVSRGWPATRHPEYAVGLEGAGDQVGCQRELRFCYEDGPCGYDIQRQLSEMGHQCVLVTPSLVPSKPCERIKTDRPDATKLTMLHRAGELTPVRVLDEAHQAIRDLVRARIAAVRSLRQARQQLSGFLLRNGRHYHRTSCTLAIGAGRPILNLLSCQCITCWRTVLHTATEPFDLLRVAAVKMFESGRSFHSLATWT